MGRVDPERTIVDAAVAEQIWQIPAHSGTGPVTIALRTPELTITDSQGTHIVISPGQADLDPS